MSNSKHNGHVTETPDVSYIKNVDVTHEVSDVHISGIAKFIVALSVLMIASFFLMWALFRSLESTAKESPPSPMALTDKERLPPEPRLQGAPGFGEELGKAAKPKGDEGKAIADGESGRPKNPLWEIKVLNEQWKDALENGPVDQSGKRYGLPIERAKEEILKQGLPVRGQKAEGTKQ